MAKTSFFSCFELAGLDYVSCGVTLLCFLLLASAFGKEGLWGNE